MPSWTVAIPSTDPPPPVTQDSRTFGRSVQFSSDYSLAPNGSYSTVEGERTAIEDIVRRWVSASGSFAFRPDYGSTAEDAVNQPMTTARIDTLRNSLRAQALQDRRVSSAQVSLTPQPDGTLRATGQVTLRGSSTTAPFDVTLGPTT